MTSGAGVVQELAGEMLEPKEEMDLYSFGVHLLRASLFFSEAFWDQRVLANDGWAFWLVSSAELPTCSQAQNQVCQL